MEGGVEDENGVLAYLLVGLGGGGIVLFQSIDNGNDNLKVGQYILL